MSLTLTVAMKMMAEVMKCCRKYDQAVQQSGSVRGETPTYWHNQEQRYGRAIRYLLARSYR